MFARRFQFMFASVPPPDYRFQYRYPWETVGLSIICRFNAADSWQMLEQILEHAPCLSQ